MDKDMIKGVFAIFWVVLLILFQLTICAGFLTGAVLVIRYGWRALHG